MTTVPNPNGAARTTEPAHGVEVPEQRGPAGDVGPLDRDAMGITTGAEMAVVATADRNGERNVRVLAGDACFVRVLDGHRIAWPDESDQPHSAARANLAEEPELAVLLVQDVPRRALHVNGTARVVPSDELRAAHPDLPDEPVPGRGSDVWVVVDVGDTYVLEGDDVPPVFPPHEAARSPVPARDRRSLLLAALAIALVVACVAVALVLGRSPATPAAAPPPPAPAPAGPTGPVTLYGRVLDVADPATIVVDVAGTPTRVGVVGLDAATVPRCAAPASLAFARRTLLNQTVTLVPDPTLPPSPTPRAYVVLGSQLSYTDAAIRAGHAPAAGASQYRAVFDDEQRDARADEVGMWGPPCVP